MPAQKLAQISIRLPRPLLAQARDIARKRRAMPNRLYLDGRPTTSQVLRDALAKGLQIITAKP